MCGKRLKTFSALLVLVLLSVFSPCSYYCSAEVILEDSEAIEMLNSIQESRKDLENVKQELKESKKESEELKNELSAVKSDYSELKTSYEEQLNEAEKENKGLQTAVTITGTSSAIFFLLMIVFIII